jgi:hypothetical protein
MYEMVKVMLAHRWGLLKQSGHRITSHQTRSKTSTHVHKPDILLMPMFVSNVFSNPTPLPFSGSPLLIASSVKTLPIGFVGVIMLLYSKFIGATIAFFQAG